jgi:hypothetical protein
MHRYTQSTKVHLGAVVEPSGMLLLPEGPELPGALSVPGSSL